MKNGTLFGLAAMTLVLGLAMAPSASAQVPLPEQSTWHITEPTDVGGTVLQPGTYLITAVARPSDRNIVRVTSMDGREVFATVLTVPRPLQPGEDRSSTMFVYFPAAEGQPRVLRTWFPADPMSDGGHDIVYAEERARQLARAASRDVITYRDTTEIAEFERTDLFVVTPEERVETYVAPAPLVQTPPAQTSATQIAETRTELPRTASNTPLLALLGLLSLVGAVAIRTIR